MFEFFFKYRPVVFRQGDFVFQSPVPLWILFVGGLAVAGLGVWTYVRGRRGLDYSRAEPPSQQYQTLSPFVPSTLPLILNS